VVLIALARILSANEIINHPLHQPHVLNNFLTQLIGAKALAGDTTHTFTIENPRDGWLFSRTNALVGRAGGVQVSIGRHDGPDVKKETVITYDPGDKRTIEAMRDARQRQHHRDL
jgi:hypothetical protein